MYLIRKVLGYDLSSENTKQLPPADQEQVPTTPRKPHESPAATNRLKTPPHSGPEVPSDRAAQASSRPVVRFLENAPPPSPAPLNSNRYSKPVRPLPRGLREQFTIHTRSQSLGQPSTRSWSQSRHRSDSHRAHHQQPQRRHSFSMSEQFSGPSCRGLVEFMKSIKEIPSKHKSTFDDVSNFSIETITNAKALHIWESGDDLDGLIQLTQVMVKSRKIAEDAGKDGKKREPAIVIITIEKKGRDSFGRICDLVKHIVDVDGKKHLDGTVCAFDAIVVVKGINYTASSDPAAAVTRINTAIERVFKMQRPSTKRLVWHHGPVLSLLLTWINTTTSRLRSALSAISVTAALDLADGVKPSPLGKANSPADLQRLENYATRLGVKVVFVDPVSQLITFGYPSCYMYYWASYIHTLLPSSIIRLHFHAALDELVTFCFRLHAASNDEYGSSAVNAIHTQLDGRLARRWACACNANTTYTKDACRATAKDKSIHHAVQIADSPFALLNHAKGYPLPAFSRIPLCPSASSTGASSSPAQAYIAAPVAFTFSSCTLHASSTSPFRILLPREGQDVDKITARIQGTMMGVTEVVRREKGNPMPSREEKEEWRDVVKACKWALKGCEGKLPEGVGEKVKCVDERFGKGTWGFWVGKGGRDEVAENGWR